MENSPAAWSSRAERLEASWDAAGWTEHGQTQRFLAVRDALELRAGDTVLDYGCGTGRFCEFLPRTVEYFAYDTAEGMRDRCALDHPRATVLTELPDDTFDHVAVIGAFNLPGSITRTLVAIQRLFPLARRTLALSLYRGHDPRCLSYEPGELVALAARMTPRWRLVADHLENDLLLVLRR